jgi:hypothetical protein
MLIEEYNSKQYEVKPLITPEEKMFQCGGCDLYDACESDPVRDRFPFNCQSSDRDDSQDVYFVEVKNV